jgi:flagellin
MDKTFTPKPCNLKSQIQQYGKYLTNILNAELMLSSGQIGISSIIKLLAKQKELATLAGSGALSMQSRSLLDTEFTELAKEIDRIAEHTNYLGQKLLDGTLYSPAELRTKDKMNSIATQGKLEIKAPLKAGDFIQINDVSFIVKKAEDLIGFPNEIAETNTAQDATTSLMNAINSTIYTLNEKYTYEKQQLSGLKFITKGSNITISSKSAGEDFNENSNKAITIGGNLAAGEKALLVNNHPAGNSTVPLSLTGLSGTNGDLSAGRTMAKGMVADTIIDKIDTFGISNNPDFLGEIRGFEALYNGQRGFNDVILEVGDYIYIAKNVPNAPTEKTTVRFTSQQDGGGYFDLTINRGYITGECNLTDQIGADLFASRLNKAFEGISFYQNRDVESYIAAGSIYPTESITSVGSLAGSSFKFINDNFNNISIENVDITPCKPDVFSYDIKIKIDGHNYRSGFDANGKPEKNIKCYIEPRSSIALLNEDDPNSMIIFNYAERGWAPELALDSSYHTQAVEQALKWSFGIDQGGSSIAFKAGDNEDDIIKVQIPPATIDELFKDSNGNTIDERHFRIDTQYDAFMMSEILDLAISRATSIQTTILSLNERFVYAEENINQQIQNLESALGYEDIICVGNTEFA